MPQRYFYILYDYDNELPVCFASSIKEVSAFLGSPNDNNTSSVLSHFFSGRNSKIRDKAGNYYTAAKFKEAELV